MAEGGRAEDVVLVISRSKNENKVVYSARRMQNPTPGSKFEMLDPKDPIEIYWLDIDPEYIKKVSSKPSCSAVIVFVGSIRLLCLASQNRAKGVMSDRMGLNGIEKKLAYGFVLFHFSMDTWSSNTILIFRFQSQGSSRPKHARAIQDQTCCTFFSFDNP